MRKLLILGCIIISTNALAEMSYSKEQLNRMISRGEYPEQGIVNKAQTNTITFYKCKTAVEKVMVQLRGAYPVETIVDTNAMYMVKAWTNDGAITATCSQLDRKMIITQASYK